MHYLTKVLSKLADLIDKFLADVQYANIITSPVVTNVSQVLIAANPNRKGLIIYNNSSNTIYIAFASTASSSTKMTTNIFAFSSWTLPQPIYKGVVSGIRNAGTGVCFCTEMI